MMNYFTFDDRTKRYEHYYTTIAELEKMLQKFVRDEKKLLNEIEKECLNYNDFCGSNVYSACWM